MKSKADEHSDIVETSVVMRFAKRVYNAAFSGFFGSAVSDYSNKEKKFEEGFFGGKSNKNGEKSWTRSFFSRARRAAIVSLENSRIHRALGSAADFLLGAGCKFYGFFFLYFGLAALLADLIKRFAFGSDVSSGAWLFGLFFIVISLPLIISRKCFGKALAESKIFSFILFDLFGVSERNLKAHRENSIGSKRYFWAALTGTLTGCATYFLSPLYMPAVLVSVLLLVLVINIPASGVLLTVIFAPISVASGISPFYIAVPVVLTAVCLVRKIFLGKVIFKLEISDFFMGLFLAFTVLGGFFTLGGNASRNTALLLGTFLLFYFVTVALITTREWLVRITGCAAVSAACALVISVVRPVVIGAENGDSVINIFESFGERLTGSLRDPYSYGVFLTLAFPFFILGCLGGKRTSAKLASLVFAAISVAGLVLYGSLGTQIGLLISLVIFIFLYRYTAIPLVIPTLLLSAVIVSDRGKNIVSLLTSRFEISPHTSRLALRFDTWKQAFAAAKSSLFAGVGVGSEAIGAAFSRVASFGSIPDNCRSQYVEYLVALGLPGLLLFIVSVTLVLRSGLELMRGSEPEGKTERGVCTAGISGMSAILAEGLVNCVFTEPAVFFAFFACAAITASAARIGRKRTLAHIEY